MAENVLGVGRDKSLAQIIATSEAELRRTQGSPRQITGRSELVDWLAKRADFKGEFDTFSLRVSEEHPNIQEALKVVEANKELCECRKEDGRYVILAPARGSTDYAQARTVIDEITKPLKLPETWRIEGAKYRVDPISIEMIFKALVEYKASDAHLSPGSPPIFRVDNQARYSELMPPLSGAQVLAAIREIAPDADWEEFEKEKQCSFSYHQAGVGYARVSCFMKAGAPHMTLRYLPESIPSFQDLHMPTETLEELAKLHRGLLLVTGMTGSGKTTTAAALVDWINQHKQVHILTIENPVEYVHRNKHSVVSQRSLGIDVRNFNEGIRGALRHDPDVIVIGEMRDPDTIRSAISAAATGHLVISTLHSNSASEVVNRIVSFFEPVERDLVKLQLRDCLRCIICQRLVPKKGGGRVPALEVMFNDMKPIADAIIEGDTDGIRIGMQQTISHSFLFETYLHRLVKKGDITEDAAREFATDVSILDQMMMGTYSVPRLDTIRAHH